MRRGGSEPLEPDGEEGAAERDIAEDVRVDREHLRQLQRERRSRVVKALVAVALLVLFIIFIVSNSHPETVDFVFVEREIGLIWVMVACALIGGLIGYLIGRPGKQIRFHRREQEEQDRKR